jgi:hypothetical protein
MYDREVVIAVQQLLAAGLSRRRVATLTNVSRGFVNQVALGNRKPEDRSERFARLEWQPMTLNDVGRCAECGAIVCRPCLACMVRELARRKGQLYGYAEYVPPADLELELHGSNLRRYKQVRAKRDKMLVCG